MLLAAAFYDRYWRWRDCFNDLGRCYDPVSQNVYLEQAGLVWGGLAVIFLLAAACPYCAPAAEPGVHLLGWKTGVKTGILTATYGLWRGVAACLWDRGT